ncbi:MAG TPA: FAD-binding oxidoreductase [Gammaproteobacteria bacterium]
MPLPPGVSRRDFEAALREFEQVVGEDWVFSSAEDVALYRDAYSPFWDEDEERLASAAVAPDGVEQVQAVVNIAGRYRIPLYAISTGRNLAYGGAAPALSGSVVLDLKRMNRVLEVSEKNAYALVEPGVSYFDLYRYIQDRGLKVWIDVPLPGWGSLIGNALDHGAGVTPMRDHFSAQCGMEVVLANGDVLRTGMGALPGAATWQQFKYGIGPLIDGLFSQSNFGIVTKMGIWLLPEPEVVRSLRVIAPRHDDVIAMLEILSNLFYSGVIDSHVQLTSPVLNGARDAERAALLARTATAEDWDGAAERRNVPFWNLRLTFYGARKIVDARWEYARERYAAIRGVRYEDGPTYGFPMSADERSRVAEKNIVGIPSLSNFAGRTPANPEVADGHMDFSVIVPMDGRAVLEALKTLGHAFAEAGAGNLGTIQSFHTRALLLINSFPTMRGDRDANRRVRAAYERAVKVAAEHGWGQYRVHAGFMDLALATYSFNDNALTRFHHALKDGLDPNGILSPGRYGIWPKHLRELKGSSA